MKTKSALSSIFVGLTGLVLCGLILSATSPQPALADEIYTFVVKKQEEKQKYHWSISEWLETRDKMRLMDLWLALHSPSPYEFFIDADYEFNQKQSVSYKTWRFGAAAYASIFGLEIQKEGTPNRLTGLFDLRIFGYNNQNTNITLQTGLASRTEDVTFRNPVFGGGLTLYLARRFGLDGFIRHYFASVGSPGGMTVSGTRYEGGAFIDFKFLRVFATYFSEPETRENAALGLASSSSSSGITLGSRFYF